jgi:hypothetical protein
VEGATSDLNRVFHAQMTKDIASARRLQQCLDRLRGYPDWPTKVQQDLAAFYADLTVGQRTARLIGSELDAALQDPRWIALGN